MSPPRRPAAAALLALVAAAGASARFFSRPPADEVVSAGSGFAVRPPKGWLVLDPDASRALGELRGAAAPQELMTALESSPLAVAFQAPAPQGRYAPTISVAIAPAGTRLLEAGASLSAPLGPALGPVTFRAEPGGPERVVSIAEVRTAGRTALFKTLQTAVPGRGRDFIVTCVGPDEDFAETDAACRTVTSSIHELAAPTAAFAGWGSLAGAAACLLYALAL